jgi:two-component system OmpR family response regulator
MIRTETAKARVLIVDQEQNSLDELTALLSASGYQVITVCTGCEALNRLDERGADVVLANLVLPDMSGLDLLKRIKERDDRIGVFLMGVHITPPVILESLNGGAVDLLYKPFVTLTIIRKIDHLLSQSPPIRHRREKKSA